ncbi:CotH kinase family protein [Anaeromyxobacter sp. Fw109-5]|uniref:CotH kinase family protein n=1 Tax=Anaeromyxobacter sp. (strain Fw109-5) TaxID=404589 RepID=UPI0013051258|nr:CotH kinase family protein [Anaeromyxobacter sp. Fw109-5]
MGAPTLDPPFVQPPGEPPPPPPSTVSYPLACADLYADGALPTFEIEISEADWAALEQDRLEGEEIYYPVVFRHEGEVVTNAMMRLRGGNSRCGDKAQFAIAFNQVDPRGRFHGLRRLNLDHGGCRLLHERLAMSFMRDLGVPAPCVNNARLVVNGRYYGLFVNLEHVNQDFLERSFGEEGDDGNLYKGGLYLRTNEQAADYSGLEAYRSAPDVASLAALADLEASIREWAGEAVLPVHDNYWSDGWNYYLYDHPTRGFLFIPNDIDMPFTTAASQPILPAALQYPAGMVLADPVWRARFDEAVRRAIAAYDTDAFDERIDRWWAQIAGAAAEDPHAIYTAGDAEELRWRVHVRREWLLEVADDPAAW